MKTRHILGICLVLTVSASAGPAQSETEYFALFIEGSKTGYAIQSRVISGGKVTTTEKVNTTMSRLGVATSMNTTESCIETADGKPLGFEAIQALGGMEMKMKGTIDEQGTVHLTTASMGTEQSGTFAWPSGAAMAEGLRLLALKKGLKEGTTYTAKLFSPSLQQALDTQVSIGPKQNVDLLGRVVALTKIITVMTIPGAGEIVSTSYVDDELRVQKNIMPVMGMRIEMIACAKEFALGQGDVLELVERMFLASPQPLGDISSVESIIYHLSPTSGAGGLTIPSNDNQSVRPDRDGAVIVTVKPVAAPAGVSFPYKGTDQAILDATRPTRFLQSDRREIIELARRAVGNTKDAAEAIRQIEEFVAGYIENKSLSVGYASAAEVAAGRQGDCSEFAVLTAAMCRSVGIPAQVVVGVAYVKDFAGLQDRFGGHAWVQAYVGGKWVGLDAAFKSAGLNGYGPGHIALAAGNGNPEDFFELVTTLGRFRIDKVIVNKRR